MILLVSRCFQDIEPQIVFAEANLHLSLLKDKESLLKVLYKWTFSVIGDRPGRNRG